MATSSSKPPNAIKARWYFQLDDLQNLVIAEGVFDHDDPKAAENAAKHLRLSKMAPNCRPIRDSGAGDYVVRLSATKGDNMEAFEHWAHTHNLLPELLATRKQEKITPPTINATEKIMLQKEIGRLPWQAIEIGYNAIDGFGVDIPDPKKAIKIATVLQEQHLIEYPAYKRLIQEASSANIAPGQVFRIAIMGDAARRLDNQYPNIASQPNWKDQLKASTSQPTNPGKPR